jgi:hypothetical protein
MTIMKSGKEKVEAMKEACLEKTEACLEGKEPASLEIEPMAVHEEAPKEEAAVKTVRAVKKRNGDQHLAVRHSGQMKKWTQGSGRSWNKLTATRKEMTHCAGMARCKGRSHKGPTVRKRRQKNRTRDNVARGASKGRTFRKRQGVQPECSNGIRD